MTNQKLTVAGPSSDNRATDANKNPHAVPITYHVGLLSTGTLVLTLSDIGGKASALESPRALERSKNDALSLLSDPESLLIEIDRLGLGGPCIRAMSTHCAH